MGVIGWFIYKGHRSVGLPSYLIVISIHDHINPALHFLLRIQFFLLGPWQEGHGIGVA